MAVQTPFIDTRVGTGGAVVLQRNNNTEDLKELAYTAGYNSEGAKKRRITKNLTNQVGDFKPEMKGLLPVQVADIEENLKGIKETISSGKFLEEHGSNAPQVAEDMLYEFRNTIDLHKSAAEEANKKINAYASLNPNDIENYDALKGVRNPNYGYSPSSEGVPKRLTGRELAAAIQADARSANQIFKNEYEVPKDFVFNKVDNTVNRGGKSVQNVNYQIDETSRQRAATINSNRLKSAMAQKAGQAPLNAQEDITYFEDVEDYIIENHKSEFNGATEEERTAMRFKYGTEFLIDKARGAAKKEDSETTEPLKPTKPTELPNKGKYDTSKFSVTQEIIPSKLVVEGSDINMGNTTRGVSKVPSSSINVTFGGETTKAETRKIFYDDDENKMVLVNVSVKPNDASSLKSAVEEKIVSYDEVRGSLESDELELYDNLYEKIRLESDNKVEGFTQAEADEISRITKRLKDGYSNKPEDAKILADIAFGDRATEVDDPSWSGSDIAFTIDGETKSYDLNDDAERAEFFKFAANKKKGSTQKTKTPTVGTTDDLPD